MNLGFFSSQTLLDPVVHVEGGYLYTTAGTVINPTQGVSAMNSLGQEVNPSNLNVYIYRNGTKVTINEACQTPGVYNVYYIFGDAYRGQVEYQTRLLVADPSDGSIPGCSPTPVPETQATESTEASSSSSSESSSSSSESQQTEPTTSETTEATTTESTTQPPVVDDPPADEEPPVA